MRKKIGLLVILSLLMPTLHIHAEEEKTEKDLSSLISKVSVTQNGMDIINGDVVDFDNPVFQVNLEYKTPSDLTIEQGDKLTVKLEADEGNKDFISMNYETSIKNVLKDKETGNKIASLNLLDRKGVEFTFEGMNVPFTAEVPMPFIINTVELSEYFEGNLEAEFVDFSYTVNINDKKTDKKIKLRLNRPKIENLNPKLTKTKGVYKPDKDGELGEGSILYNLNFSTKLKSPNEYIIYDTPDVNHKFNGNLKVFLARRQGGFDRELELVDNHMYIGNSHDETEGMELKVYDIYFKTETDDPLKPKQAQYEKETMVLESKNPDGSDLLSMSEVTKPKDIILEKPASSELNDEENNLIETSGGLNKGVGKGFKVIIKNFKNPYYDDGGLLTFVYHFDIVNNSPLLNDDGLSIYLNTAMHYGQEIPTCDLEDEDCIPIKSEKTKLSEVNNGNKTSKGEVTPGDITGEIDKYSPVDFIKVEMNDLGKPNFDKPLSGAVFNIYKLEKNKEKVIAITKDNVRLEKVETNSKGKLVDADGQEINLLLERGNYIFDEIKAPDGYETINKETFFTVGYLTNKFEIMNKKIVEEKKYAVTYEFESLDKEMELPQEILDQVPESHEELLNGSKIIPKENFNKELKVDNGIWTFSHWDKNEVTIDGKDEHFIAYWKFEVKEDIKPPVEPEKPDKEPPVEPEKPDKEPPVELEKPDKEPPVELGDLDKEEIGTETLDKDTQDSPEVIGDNLPVTGVGNPNIYAFYLILAAIPLVIIGKNKNE